MEALSDAIVRSVWGGSWVKYDWVPAAGSAGGIFLMWDDRSLEVKKIKKGAFSLAALVKDRVSEWGGVGIWGSVRTGRRRVQGVFLGRTGKYYGGIGHSMGSRKVFVVGTGSNWTEGRRKKRVLSSWSYRTRH